MKRLYAPILAGLILLSIIVSLGAERVASRLVLYARVVRLYTQDPPSSIKMPFPDISKEAIADTWQAPRGENRLHVGQDIFAPRGTPIYSASEGYVYNIGENRLGGQTVSVVGAGGRFYYYAHLDSYEPELEEGDFVTTRSVLGYVGTTGNARGTPPHLHFGVYTAGGPINPLPLLSDRTKPANRDANDGVKSGKSRRAITRRTQG